MTECTGKPAEEFLEAYLLGTLPEEDAQRFEEHYFDCPVCLSQVEALQAASRQLHLAPRHGLRPTLAWPYRLAAVGAIAALLLIGFVVLHGKHPQPAVAHAPLPAAPPVPGPSKPAGATPVSLAQLADLALPPFRGSTLRGDSQDSHFTAGMKAYQRGDCAQSVTALSQVPAADSDSPAARFFSGVCLMHRGQLPQAAKSLRAVAEAGDSPQQEAALYYLAQIALASNDAATARHDLARTVTLRGDFEARARAQLARLPAVGSTQ